MDTVKRTATIHALLTDKWKQETARLGGEALVSAIVVLVEAQESLLTRIEEMETRQIEQQTLLNDLRGAFVDGDLEGHRRYHQTMIELLEERRRLSAAVKEKTISGLVWVIILAVGTALWEEVKRKLGAK